MSNKLREIVRWPKSFRGFRKHHASFGRVSIQRLRFCAHRYRSWWPPNLPARSHGRRAERSKFRVATEPVQSDMDSRCSASRQNWPNRNMADAANLGVERESAGTVQVGLVNGWECADRLDL